MLSTTIHSCIRSSSLHNRLEWSSGHFVFCVTGNSTISRPPSHEDFLVMDNNDDLLGFRSILYNLTLSLVIGFFLTMFGCGSTWENSNKFSV